MTTRLRPRRPPLRSLRRSRTRPSLVTEAPLTLLACLVIVGFTACSPAPPAALDISHLELRACAPGSDRACLRSTLAVDPGVAALGEIDASRWSAHVDDVEFPVARVREYPGASPHTRIMILVDGSASMGDGTLQIVRSVLRSFLSTIPATTEVAVAPFSSVRVDERIGRADFDVPEAAAGALLDFPPPANNTGLYSAIQIGARRLAATRPSRGNLTLSVGSPAGVAGGIAATSGRSNDHLIVVTDGTNDVGSQGDDSGLLEGIPGRDAATDAVVEAGVHLWVLGVGDRINRGELEALAAGTTRGFTARGSRIQGNALSVPLRDPILMGHALDKVDRSLRVGRELIVRVPPWARRYLDRGPAIFTLRRQTVGEPRMAGDFEAELVRRASWRPPLFTAVGLGPALANEVGNTASEAPLRWQDQAIPRGFAIMVVFALSMVILSQVVPPLLWPLPGNTRGNGAASPATAKKKNKQRTDSPNHQSVDAFILSNVRAAPPRGVDDETRSRAERG